MLHYRRALSIYPDYAAAAFGIGNLYSLKGLDGGALHWYEQALRLEPKFAKAHLQIGLLRQRRGELRHRRGGVPHRAGERAEQSAAAGQPQRAAPRGRATAGAPRPALLQLDGIGTLDTDEQELVAAVRDEIEIALR